MLSLSRWAKPLLVVAIINAAAFGAIGAANAIDVTDQRNRTIAFDKLPSRLVFIPIPAPSTFMTIDGTDAKIVGMNDYSARAMHEGIFGKLFPGFTRIRTGMTTGGDAANFAPNVEAILSQQPDAIFQWATDNDVISVLDRTGIPVLGMRVGSFENYVDYIKLMGKVAGKEQRAAELLQRQDETRKFLAARFADLQKQQRPSVLYFNRAVNMLRVSGKGTAQDLAIRLAGGQNAMGDTPSISTVTIEQILTWNPQVILLGNFDPAMPSDLYNDPRWQGVDAVRNHRVYRVPLGGYRWDPPSHESALGWLWLAGLLHPESMPENLRSSVRDWFGFLYDYNPTDEEIDNILFVRENAGSLGYDSYRAH
jgi:iron complex transport system substrate-binding protein